MKTSSLGDILRNYLGTTGISRKCPDCGCANLEHREHLFDINSTYHSPPDCTWLECPECGYKSEPE